MTLHGLIKYIALMFCSHYIVARSLGKRVYAKNADIARLILFIIAGSVMLCLSSEYLPEVKTVFMVGAAILFNEVYFAEDREQIIKATFFSYAASFACSYLILLLYGSVAVSVSAEAASLTVLTAIVVAVMQLVITVALFRIKRISKGLASFFDSYHGDFILCFSAIVLFVISLWTSGENRIYLTAVVLSSVLLIAILVFFWTRAHLKKNYLERINLQKYKNLEEMTAAQAKDIESMSSIIHRDNKLVPALTLYADSFVGKLADQNDAAERSAMARDFVTQLRKIASDRRGVITDMETGDGSISSTGIVVIDSIMLYMARRAASENIRFSFNCACNIREMLSKVSENDVSTLLADLTENALIAVRHSTGIHRNVSVEIALQDGSFCITVKDSGIPFPRQVLEHLGRQRITTHGDDGGSGIGMMTVCELCRKYRASLRITPLSDEEYTKAVSVVFDDALKMPSAA